MLGFISKTDIDNNVIYNNESFIFCRIGCDENDENTCSWDLEVIKCNSCKNELTFLMQFVNKLSHAKYITYYIFFCANEKDKCALANKGWKIIRTNRTNFSGFTKFPKHLNRLRIEISKIKDQNKNLSRKGSEFSGNGKEEDLLKKYNLKKDNDDEWAIGEGDLGWVGEVYERGKYKELLKLQEEVSKEPNQVVRISGKPLLLKRIGKIPSCSTCFSKLNFGFQLLPTLGYHLSKHQELDEYQCDILCNNLLVFTCPNHCSNSEADEMILEFFILQIEF